MDNLPHESIEEISARKDQEHKMQALQELWRKLHSMLKSICLRSFKHDAHIKFNQELMAIAQADRLEFVKITHGEQVAQKCLPLLRQIEMLEQAR